MFNTLLKQTRNQMYLSEQIKAMAKRKKPSEKSLVSKNYSCGIFQKYDQIEAKETKSVLKE